MKGCVVVELRGMSGGLIILLKNEEEVELMNYSQWHMNVLVKGEGLGDKWLLTAFYGNLEASNISIFWELLKSLTPPFIVGWCVMGDFNEIMA